MTGLSDAATLEFYSESAVEVSIRQPPARQIRALQNFLRGIPADAQVLDLACGSGWASEVMIHGGLKVTAADGSGPMAALASARLGRPVPVMLFDELGGAPGFDGVFACAALPHAPRAALPLILSRIASCLRSGGLFYGCFISGEGEYRDAHGRYFARYQADELLELIAQTPGMHFASLRSEFDVDSNGDEQIFFGLSARKLACPVI